MSSTPRERRFEKNKKNILDAAQKLIAKKGYENVSLREIARKADFSPAGLYEYFDSKEQLLLALRERINRMMMDAVQDTPAYETAQEKLVAMGLAYVHFAVNYSEYFNLVNALPPLRMLQDSPDVSSSPFNVFEAVVVDLVEELSLKLEEGFGTGELTYSFWTMIHGMANLQITHMQGFEADYDAINQRILKIFMKGLKGL